MAKRRRPCNFTKSTKNTWHKGCTPLNFHLPCTSLLILNAPRIIRRPANITKIGYATVYHKLYLITCIVLKIFCDIQTLMYKRSRNENISWKHEFNLKRSRKTAWLLMKTWTIRVWERFWFCFWARIVITRQYEHFYKLRNFHCLSDIRVRNIEQQLRTYLNDFLFFV